jgi:hypothetical protein
MTEVEKFQKMPFSEWAAKYRPLKKDGSGLGNPDQDAISEYMHEPRHPEYARVMQAKPECIWTVTVPDDSDPENDGDDLDDEPADTPWLIDSGFHFVNYMGLIICEVPFDDSDGKYMQVEY